MPDVTIGLDKWLEGEKTLPSIITKIRSLDADTTGPRLRTVIIPAGRGAGLSVDLAEGRYLIEASLPNGDVAATSVTVKPTNNEPVFLRATDSVHEWLSWQDLAGHAPAGRTSSGDDMYKDLVPGAQPQFAPPVATSTPTPIEVVTTAGPPGALLKALPAVWKGEPLKALALAPATPAPPQWANFDPALGVTAYLFGKGPWHQAERYYALVRTPPAGPPLLAVLPLPWFQTDHSGDATIDVLVDESDASATSDPDLRDQDWPLGLSVVVRDNLMASVFGYLTSGDLPAAAQVAETAVDRLEEKLVNAIAAAGAAYILVRSATGSRKRPIWVPWLKNLRAWFTWLPDGAILDGWAHLNGIGREPDVNAARTAFVDAVDRGLPFYTAGVRLLFEGMTRVAASSPPDKKMDGFAAAYEIARRLALRIDVRQTFTVVRME